MENGNGTVKRHESEESLEDEDIEDFIPTPPDGGWGWMVVLASLVCNIVVDGIGYSFGVLLPIFKDYFQAPNSQVTLIGSLLVGVYLCAGPIVSGLVNKFGCRAVAIAGSIVATGGFILGSFAPTLEVLILSYGVLGGLGFGMVYLPSIVTVGYYFEKKRAIATGIAVCGSGIGTLIFSPLNDFLLEIFDWRNLLFLQAGIILNCVVCAMLMRPLEPKKKKKKIHSDREKEEIRHHFKVKAQRNRRRVTESESSVQDVKTFAKLREAKLMREKILNETESDIGSMPSEYFVKGHLDSNPPTPVGTPKVFVGTNGSAHNMATSPSTPENDPGIVGERKTSSVSDKLQNTLEVRKASVVSDSIPETVEGRKTSSMSDKIPDIAEEKNDGSLSGNNKLPDKGHVAIAAHEVEPLIENGYTKIQEIKRPKIHHAHHQHKPTASQMKIGSYRDIVAHKEDFARPLYRKDIFYSGSIVHIPDFQSQPDMESYITSITSIPGISEVPRTSIWDNCTCLPKSVIDTLKEMLDFSLLLDFNFAMLCLGNLFAMSGFYVPFTYTVVRATKLGISSSNAALLLSVIGIANTIGRILSGFLADLPNADALVINNVALVVSTISVFLQPLCTSYETLIVFSVVYGLCVSAYISLTSIIICDLVGLNKLTNAFGLLTLCRGIAGIYGPPVAGSVCQATGNYDASFYLGGGMFLVGTLFHLVLHLPCARNRNKKAEVTEVIYEPADGPVAV